MQKFIGGIGCFWDETEYQGVPGIISTECGYCGGKNPKVTYEQVCGGDTEHIEVVKVIFDPKIISYEDITRLFFKIHDPTTLNRQGADIGTQYRSAIFYVNEEQKIVSEKYKKVLNESDEFQNSIVTEITKLDTFYSAENYHQDYYKNNSFQPYCRLVIKPKLDKFFTKNYNVK